VAAASAARGFCCYDRQYGDAIHTFVNTPAQKPDSLYFLELFRRKHSGTNASALCPWKCMRMLAELILAGSTCLCGICREDTLYLQTLKCPHPNKQADKSLPCKAKGKV